MKKRQTKEEKIHKVLLKGDATLENIIDIAELPNKNAARVHISRLQKKLGGAIRKRTEYNDGRITKYYSIDNTLQNLNGIPKEVIYSPAILANDIEHPLTKNEKQIMSVLETGDRLTIYEISKKTGLFRQNILKNIKRLKSKGAHIEIEDTGQFAKKIYHIPPMTLDNMVAKVWNDLPITSFDNPYEIEIKDPEHQKIMAINTPYIGAICTDNPFKHPVKNALRYANADNIDTVILTGNSIFMDLMRYSNLKPYRSKVSGIKTDPKLVQYPDSIVKSGRSPEEQLENNKPVYVTFKERLDHVVEMARKIFRDEDGNPLYNGPIYLKFGNKEEMLSVQQTNEIVRINRNLEGEYVREQLNSLANEKRSINSKIRKKIKTFIAESGINTGNIPQKGIENLMLNNLDDFEKEYWDMTIQERDRIDAEVQDWITYRSRVIMSNTNDEFINLCSKTMQAYIIKELSAAIPNSRFISVGDAHLKLGSNKIKVVYDRTTESIKDNLIGKLRMETQAAIKNGKQQPDLIIGGGLNPTYTRLMISYDTAEGHKSVTLSQLPTCLDKKLLEDIASNKVKDKEELTKIASEDYSTGVTIFEWIGYLPKRKILTNDFLTNEQLFSEPKKLKQVVEGRNTFYMELESDTHRGSRFTAFFSTKDDVVYFDQVAHNFLKDLNAPIVKYSHLGDETQAHNYPTEQETNRRWKNDFELVAKINEIITESKSREESEMRLKKLIKKQFIRSGILNQKDQVESYIQSQDLDYLAGIIKRAQKSGLYVTDRVGVIDHTRGNHDEHTSYGEYNDVEIIANQLGMMIELHDSSLKGKARNLIKAPLDGQLGLVQGLIGIVDKKDVNMNEDDALRYHRYLYAIKAKHKQGTAKNTDSMRPTQKMYDHQGSTQAYQIGRFGINLSGDDHFGGEKLGGNTLHVKSGCQMYKSPYGEKWGFTLPNLLINLIGLPKDGPAEGPLEIIDIRYEDLKRYNKQEQMPNKYKLFKNSVIKV